MNLNGLPPVSLHCSICRFFDDANMHYAPQAHLDSCNQCKSTYTELSKDANFPQVFKTVMTWALFYDHLMKKKKDKDWAENGTAPYWTSSAKIIYEGHFNPMSGYQAEMKKVLSPYSNEFRKRLMKMVEDMIPAVK